MRAIFLRDFNYTSRKVNAGWSIKASPEPQSFPREVIEAALERKTVAIPVPVFSHRRADPEPDEIAG